MSSELARRPEPLADRMMYAKALAEANLLPPAYRKQPANVLLAMEYGDALGLSPIAAIQGVHIIDGKPSASAQLIGALVRRAGHRLRVVVSQDGTGAKATIVRSDDPDFTFEAVWTMDRAKAAGLLGKGTWAAYPTNLLKARAITEVARDACPEALSGVAYTAEELGGDTPELVETRITRHTDRTPTEWDTPPEVTDAEVVDIRTGELLADAQDAADLEQSVERHPAKGAARFTGASDAQLALIVKLLRQLAADAADINPLLSRIVGRDVDKLMDLSKVEASDVIRELKQAHADITTQASDD